MTIINAIKLAAAFGIGTFAWVVWLELAAEVLPL